MLTRLRCRRLATVRILVLLREAGYRHSGVLGTAARDKQSGCHIIRSAKGHRKSKLLIVKELIIQRQSRSYGSWQFPRKGDTRGKPLPQFAHRLPLRKLLHFDATSIVTHGTERTASTRAVSGCPRSVLSVGELNPSFAASVVGQTRSRPSAVTSRLGPSQLRNAVQQCYAEIFG